jgi:hypothetical protein
MAFGIGFLIEATLVHEFVVVALRRACRVRQD